jgi:hypothetical protein
LKQATELRPAISQAPNAPRRRNPVRGVFIDQKLFSLDAKQYEEFVRVLDQPPEPNIRLKQLLASKSPLP